ncbi:apolipoprotein L2-like [Rhynchocyon petersi]
MAVEHMLQIGQLDRQTFLSDFPQKEMELKECIRKLHALADKHEKIHKDCTISKVVATSTGIVSSILTITGMALAPVTAGISLGLTATGIGLGTAATITGVSASIVDLSSSLSAKAQANKLTPTDSDIEKEVLNAIGENTAKLASTTSRLIQDSKTIGKNINAIKLTQANPKLAANARRLTASGKIPIQKSRQVQKVFEGTALALPKQARIMGMATIGFSLLMDVASLVEESKHLYEGAKTASAEELRQKASIVEWNLEDLVQIHESLQRLAQWEKRGR